jgi:uncharacterized protein YkwD
MEGQPYQGFGPGEFAERLHDLGCSRVLLGYFLRTLPRRRGTEAHLFNRLVLVLVIALGAVVLFTGSAGVPRANADGTCATNDSSLDGEERALVDLTNSYRVQHGLSGLSVSAALEQAATWMATDMTTKSGFGHTDSLGRPFFVRQADCGYGAPGGENIGAGSARVSGAQAFDLFHNSAEHDAIMLSPEFHEIGVSRVSGGQYGWYWAVEFGRGGSAPAPPPPPAPAATAPPPPPQAPAEPAARVAAPPPPAAGPASAAAVPSAPSPAAESQPESESAPAAAPALPGRPGFFQLQAGTNLLSWAGPGAHVSDVLASAGGAVSMVYGYDPLFGMWLQYSPGAPEYLQTPSELQTGEQYWVIARSSGELAVGAAGE